MAGCPLPSATRRAILVDDPEHPASRASAQTAVIQKDEGRESVSSSFQATSLISLSPTRLPERPQSASDSSRIALRHAVSPSVYFHGFVVQTHGRGRLFSVRRCRSRRSSVLSPLLSSHHAKFADGGAEDRDHPFR